jgi:MFS family permease
MSPGAAISQPPAGVLRPGSRFESDVTRRLDRLPWSPWHWRIVASLGITWMLDGLEVTLVGAIGPVLTQRDTLGLTSTQLGGTATAYLAGAVLGALTFGRLTDLYGRKRLFLITLAVYLTATLASGLAWGFWSFALFRFFTGSGIGGEYSAVNSAVDELIPARVRGRADLAINSTYWLGTALGAALTLVLLDPRLLPARIGWRAVFALGAALGGAVLFLRRHVPESPRWLLLHGRVREAGAITSAIERDVSASTKAPLPAVEGTALLEAKGRVTFAAIARVVLKRHRRRSVLGLSLMIAQAFAYNGVFFTYPLVLVRFYDVAPGRVALYLLPFAVSNLVGPIVLGSLFDRVGRRIMIALTYSLSGALIVVAGSGLARGWFGAVSQTAVWAAVFFVASAAASSAYLTVSELFPVELRGMAIALFYAVGTAVGGVAAPALFGALLETGSRGLVTLGYFAGAALMMAAGGVAAVWGVSSERRSLETINTLADVREGEAPGAKP